MSLFNYTMQDVNSGLISENRLRLEIYLSDIKVALDSISVSGENIRVVFKDMITSAEELILNDLISNHSGKPLPDEILTYFAPKHVDEQNRLKVATTPQNHAEQHQAGEADEINVDGLQGVLAEDQHIIDQEAIDAMGAKSNTNPLNHDRFQQTEITNLPESQLNLNYATHNNANDPTTAQKQAMENANSPSSTNEFVVKSDLSGYSQTNHTHSTLPTSDEKAALAGNSPSATNKYATMDDIADIDNSHVAQNFSALPSSPSVNEIWKTLEDETISTNEYEAGWYQYLGSGNGTGIHDSDWKFYSTTESHTHTWSQVSKTGSKASDLADIPAYPNDGNDNELIENNGVLAWQEKTSNSSNKRSLQLDLVYYGSTTSGWLHLSCGSIRSNESGWTPPFNCKVREVVFTNKYYGSSGQKIEIKAYYHSIGSCGYIDEDDSVEWSCSNDSNSNLLYNEQNGRRWGYDCTNDNDEMLMSRAYAFKVRRTYGYNCMDDIKVTIMLEEV